MAEDYVFGCKRVLDSGRQKNLFFFEAQVYRCFLKPQRLQIDMED